MKARLHLAGAAVSFLLILLGFGQAAIAQTKYYWVGGAENPVGRHWRDQSLWSTGGVGSPAVGSPGTPVGATVGAGVAVPPLRGAVRGAFLSVPGAGVAVGAGPWGAVAVRAAGTVAGGSALLLPWCHAMAK